MRDFGIFGVGEDRGEGIAVQRADAWARKLHSSLHEISIVCRARARRE
jgi:hypothetical protein